MKRASVIGLLRGLMAAAAVAGRDPTSCVGSFNQHRNQKEIYSAMIYAPSRIYYYSNNIRATVKNIKEKNHHDDDENIASSTINNTTNKEKYNKILEEAEPCPSKLGGKRVKYNH